MWEPGSLPTSERPPAIPIGTGGLSDTLVVMGKWVHRLSDVDGQSMTATCQACGHVRVRSKYKGVFRCVNSIRESRGPRKRPHGLNEVEAKHLREEAGTCGICESADDLCVDHCHESLVVRGVLCSRCNLALGLMGDDPARLAAAIAYLTK